MDLDYTAPVGLPVTRPGRSRRRRPGTAGSADDGSDPASQRALRVNKACAADIGYQVLRTRSNPAGRAGLRRTQGPGPPAATATPRTAWTATRPRGSGIPRVADACRDDVLRATVVPEFSDTLILNTISGKSLVAENQTRGPSAPVSENGLGSKHDSRYRGANGLRRVGTLTLAPAAAQNRRSPAVVTIANLAGWRGRQLSAPDAGARSATWRGPLTRSPTPVPCVRCPGHHDRLAVPLAPPQPQPQPQPRWPVSGPSAGRSESQVPHPSRRCCRNAFWGMSRHRSLRRADADDPLEHELCTGRGQRDGRASRGAAARNPSPQERRGSARAGRTRRKKPGPKDPGRNNQAQGQRKGQASLKTGNSPLGDGINIADNDHDNSTGK